MGDDTPQNPPRMSSFRHYLAKQIDDGGGDSMALWQGSAHPYSCTCETCWSWWKQMGLGEEPDPPFTQAQLDAPTYQDAVLLTARVWEPKE